ncbi:EF-hand and coiled-coil domain-containing protein 1 isoform X2 [Dunckerocampus dactyliophorus]|uniref:EF-hand and coiled-coil domain-containing protein 1 isoform X2 n=1 Tax=Dunckerocampus dactyliophorus TaxID=161453 RepID=UPI002405854E|nr:EF-hand and coiled-coil domain-containing protein 1 isoform X2 [Dunckerocampus dactyliophorus]
MRCIQPWPRAARRSEWLRCALAHHHNPNPGVENEIVVLATGIDQYLQEVFHHLAYPNREDKVSAEDFTTLCTVLGVIGARKGQKSMKETWDGDGDEEEFGDVCSGLPCQLTFKDFHARLCGFFRVRTAQRGTGDCGWRLPVTEETELVERQILLRWPRLRRRKDVTFDLTRNHSRSTAEDTDSEELAALRELVEDLRSALQGSDARCLALEVALRREKGRTLPTPKAVPSPATSVSLVQGKLVPTRRIKGRADGGDGVRRPGRRWDTWDPLLRELKLIRSSRDGQLEEAIKFNQHLEEELRWAYQEVRKLQALESALRRENIHIRRRAEEAREALSLGLEKVRMIQEQAESVPQLQSRISQLETELERYRYRTAAVSRSSAHTAVEVRLLSVAPATRFSRVCLPDAASRKGVAIYSDAECLQRAVEGRAASDEEEEGDRGATQEGQHRLPEVKTRTNQSHDCGKGCSWKRLKQELSASTVGRGEEKTPEPEAAKATQEDKERARLSLLEEKFRDSLLLLLQLRNKRVSRRELGTIMMDTLDMCSKHGDGPCQVLQVADALYMQLSSSGYLGEGGEDKGDERESTHQPQTSPLLISC